MHLFLTFSVVTALLQSLSLGQSSLSVRDLLTDREFREYRGDPDYRDRIDLFKKVFDNRARLLRSYVTRRELEKSMELLGKLQALCQLMAGESTNAQPGDLRSKEVKQLEIRLRKLIETLHDLQSAVPFEYRDDFQATESVLEDLRKGLLAQLFGSAIARESASTEESEEGDHFFPSSLRLGLAMSEALGSALQTSDRFTDEEYQKIQLNQELEKRVEVLLEISESRLNEIRRRSDNKEWDKEEPNPLEFHTYWDMVHAYRRALDTVMINIDEKAIYKIASQKDIRRSLEKLNKKVETFIPQLEPIKQLAMKLKDEALYQEVLQAQETSVIAQKGSLYGLGAPAK